jgi:diguanylate cyclase (GGDEF)-like protein
MKRWILACPFILGFYPAWGAVPPAALTSVHAIGLLNKAEAAHALPVSFEGTITYYNPNDIDLFVQDGAEAVYVQAPQGANLHLGDRILVTGRTRASYRTDILSDSVTVLHHGSLPMPMAADFDQMIGGKLDGLRVTVHAVVRSADIVLDGNRYNLYMHLLMDGGYVDATVVAVETPVPQYLLDSEIEVTGVVAGKFDSKDQLTGILIQIPSLADLKIVVPAKTVPGALPITPMDEILSGYHVRDFTRRIRVSGTITYFEPGSAIVLQNGTKSLWINTQSEKPLHLGNLADVTGFPNASGGSLTLSLGEISESNVHSAITPRPVTAQELAAGASAFELVSIDGEVLTSVREAAQDDYVLTSNHHVFSAVFHHMDAADGVQLPAWKVISPGTTVRVTGISMVTYGSNPFQGPVSFSLLLRSFDDITVVAKPSLLTVPNLIWTVSLLVVILLAFAFRQLVLERKVHRQTLALANRIEAKADLERRIAQLEQRRSRVLEDINGSRPLGEVIKEIMEMVSFHLDGAPCWSEITDGARIGDYPAAAQSMRIVQEDIPARLGPPLGTLFAAFDPASPPAESERDALSLGVRLATLAIETRKLYSSLVHRSEFDLLTEIHNRFSFERHLESLIEQAGQMTEIFGLIYIDLDEFKQVNDLYGHKVGDMYLQEVAMRMKGQLRGRDMLARLGGDEFGALISAARSRAGVDEVAQRLVRCLDEPFAIEGYVLHASASVGVAIYPEDGTTKDSLLSAADAAMYVTKHTKQGTKGLATDQ